MCVSMINAGTFFITGILTSEMSLGLTVIYHKFSMAYGQCTQSGDSDIRKMLSVSLSDNCAESICNQGSSSIGYRSGI